MTSSLITAENGATINIRGHIRGVQLVVCSDFGTGSSVLTPAQIVVLRDVLNAQLDAIEKASS
jgi:hypothetical protein